MLFEKGKKSSESENDKLEGEVIDVRLDCATTTKHNTEIVVIVIEVIVVVVVVVSPRDPQVRR